MQAYADGSPGGFSSVLANPVFSFDSPSRSSASPGTPPVSASGAAGDTPQQQQQAPQPAALLQRIAQEHAQQAQEQHTWHVDVVLASHDAELAGVKETVSKLKAAQEATATLAEDTAMHVVSLDDRIRVIEHGQPFFAAGGLSSGAPAAPSAPAYHADPTTHPEKPDLEATLSRGMGCSSLSNAAPDAAPDAAPAAAAAGSTGDADAGVAGAQADAAQTATADQAVLVQQVLSSSLLEELISSRVAQAVAAQLAAAHTPAASADASLQQLHERQLAVEGAVQQLLSSSRAQHNEQQQSPAPTPDTSADRQQPAAGAAAAEALAAEPAACSNTQPLATDPSIAPLGVDSLQDEFSSFESASRWLSGSGNRDATPSNAPGSKLPQTAEVSTAPPPQADDPAAAAASAALAAEDALDTQTTGSAGGSPAAAAAFSCIAAQLAPPAAPLLQEEPSTTHATPTAVRSALWSALWSASSRGTSTTQVETQLAALQQEVDACQVQSALQALDAKLQQLQQTQAEQGVLIDSHKVSTGASLALMVPLEPRLDLVASQVLALHALVSQQPARFELLQSEIEQLSQQLAEVNEAAAEESDVQLLRERLEALQQQHSQLQAGLAADIQAATDAAAAAAAMASTAVDAAAAVEATQQQLAVRQEQWEQQAAAGILERLAAVEGSVQQLVAVQEGLSELQQQVVQHMQDAREQAATAAAASAEQRSILDAVAASASELAGKLIALEVAVEDKVGEVAAAVCATTQQAAAGTAALEAKLQQQERALQAGILAQQTAPTGPSSEEVQGKLQDLQEALESQAAAVSAATQQAAEAAAAVDAKLAQHDDTLRNALTAAQEAHEADLKQQLREQVDTMAQILADMGSLKAEQATACDGLQQQLLRLKDVQDSTVSDHAAQLEQLTGAAATWLSSCSCRVCAERLVFERAFCTPCAYIQPQNRL